jgi:hypothetical protein
MEEQSQEALHEAVHEVLPVPLHVHPRGLERHLRPQAARARRASMGRRRIREAQACVRVNGRAWG